MTAKEQAIFDLVVDTTVRAIVHFASKSKVPGFQILDILMPKERKIRSIVGGLETSLGSTLWEPLVKGIASSNGFQVINGKSLLMPTYMPEAVTRTLNLVISNREKAGSTYDSKTTREEIKKACSCCIKNPIMDFCQPPRGHGVDIWLKKDNVNYMTDSKTVQPNIGTYKTCLRQILTWHAYYYCKNPAGELRTFIFIPYNPYKGDFREHTIGHGLPLLKEELWVEDELWDFCSGVKDTFRIILSAFEHIRDKGLVTKELEKLFGK